MALKQFDAQFPNETTCRTYLVARRWPQGVRCPRCGNEKVYTLKARPFHWVCKSERCRKASKTGYRFSLYVGTIFENTNYPLLTWFKVLYLMLSSKKGISSLQLHRVLGTGSYRTAWYLAHRLRAGLADPEFRRLMGVVEVDETLIGGAKYTQKITHFYCRPCAEYHLKTHPHYRAARRRAARRRKAKAESGD